MKLNRAYTHVFNFFLFSGFSMMVPAFIAKCDRIKLLLWRTSKIFRSIKAIQPGNFTSPEGKSG